MAGGRLWTEDEQKFLEKWAGIKPLSWIGKKLNRNEQAVKDRLFSTGETTKDIHGRMTPAEVAEEYGCTKEHVYTLVKRGHLPAVRRQTRTSRMWITPEDAAGANKAIWKPNFLRQGQAHHMATVTQSDAQKILDTPYSISHRELAEKFGTTKTVVAGIRQRRTWRHLKPSKEWWVVPN